MSDASGREPVAPAAVTSETSVGDALKLRREERLALIARILATAGALLFAVGAWMPWVVVTGWALVGDQRQYYTLALSPGDVEGMFGSFAWSALTVVGLLLLPPLWWRSRPSVSYLALMLNSMWVMMAGYSSPSELYFGHDMGLVPDLHPRYLIITHHGQKLPGFWTAIAGVALVVVAIILSIIPIFFGLRQEWRVHLAEARSASSPSRPSVLLPGASALTVGIALWAVGTFVMPWASLDCNANPLILGTCTGLSYTSVLQIGIADATTLIDPLVAHYAVGLLLGGGAAMVLVGLWWRARSIAFCGWATLWVVLAVAFAWLADYGVGVVVEKHDALGLPAGTWSGENAVLVTMLGFVLALVGLGYLWVDVLRNRGNAAV